MAKNVKAKLNTAQKISKYLASRKTGATAYEIAAKIDANVNTVKKLIGAGSGGFVKMAKRKCKVEGKDLATYGLAA